MIDLANLRDAQAGLDGVSLRTPLIPLPLPGTNGQVRLKAEQLQPIHAFKIRGAWTAIRRLDPAVRQTGVVTSSSGNHGLGVAYAAQRLGVRAVVVMPESAPAIKANGIRALGAEVVLAGKIRSAEQTVEAERIARDEGMTLIPPYDHRDVIAGQGTVAMEILEQWPEVETIVVPVGGGGLLAGTCAAVRALARTTRVIAVEPAGIPKLSAAVTAGKPTILTGGTSLADGLLTMSVGSLTWPLIHETLDHVVAVTDAELRSAVRWLGDHDLRVEPSGSATTAAILAGKIPVTGPTVVICTGSNVDPARYQELVAG
jgi:threonine dehydratase